MSALEDYVRLVYPWDPEHENYWKCCAADFVDKQGERSRISVAAAQTFDDTIRMIKNRIKWNRSSVYMAIGIQKMSDQSKNDTNDGFPRANKSAANMHSLKALFIDVDVDPKKNATYDTVEQAIEGLEAFLRDSGMPMPTFIVWSGSGGFHCYWIFDKPLPVDDWKVMAGALKACCKKHGFLVDGAVTDDAARILRVPTSTNNKRNPVEVEMVVTDGTPIFTASELWQVLGQYGTAQARQTGTGSTVHNLSANAQNFTAGVEENAKPVPIDDVALVCPAIKAALDTGGAGYQEPQWMIDLYAAIFTTDPADAAHRMSNQHVQYTKDGTDAKLAEQQAKKGAMGWPSCATIHGKGHAECSTCPFFAQGKSPFHFVKPAQKQKQSFNKAHPGGDWMLPDDGRYWRNDQDHIITFHEDMGPLDVLGIPIVKSGFDPELNAVAYETLVQGNPRWFTVGFGGMTKAGQIIENFHKGSNGAVVIDRPWKVVRDFTMAWLTHLRDNKYNVDASAMGWGKGKGTFTFGDQIFTKEGALTAYRKQRNAEFTEERFERCGSPDPWRHAMEGVYGNTAMECVVATAFAAPLVSFVVGHSLITSAQSYGTARGKTTALKIAQAVWGSPRASSTALDDTGNNVVDKLAMLRNLPVYWDELKTDEERNTMVKVVFTAAQGKSKGRLRADATRAGVRTFTTMLTVASNAGIFDNVMRDTTHTDAAAVRVFEWDMPEFKVRCNDADQRGIKLDDNYGEIGAAYAQYLVANKDDVDKLLNDLGVLLGDTCKFNEKERFWRACMITLIGGAILANNADLTRFDVQAIMDFCVSTLNDLRNRVHQQVQMFTGATGADEIIGTIIRSTRGKALLETNIIWTTKGKPSIGAVMRLDMYADRSTGVWVQYGREDGRILVQKTSFNRWCKEQKYSARQVLDIIRADYVVTEPRCQFGAGVETLVMPGREWCYLFTPKVPPPPKETDPRFTSRSPSGSSANFG